MVIKYLVIGLFCISILVWVDFIVLKMICVNVFLYVYVGGWEYFVGGGVVSFDCNLDSYFDFYVVGGENYV